MKRYNLIALLIAIGCSPELGVGVSRGGGGPDDGTSGRLNAHEIRNAQEAEQVVAALAQYGVQPLLNEFAGGSKVARTAEGMATVTGSPTDATINFENFSIRTPAGVMTLSGGVRWQVADAAVSLAVGGMDIEWSSISDSFDATAQRAGNRFTGKLTSMTGDTFTF